MPESAHSASPSADIPSADNPSAESPYATPRHGLELEDCGFYHAIDIPGVGLQKGLWDLRATVGSYLGEYDAFSGKRVLEVGCANGFLSFHMESKGAEVVAYDLCEKDRWDVVPYARWNTAAAASYAGTENWRQWSEHRSSNLRRLNNAFWFTHAAFESKVRLVHGNAYQVPKAIGYVDLCTFGSILLHLRDPFQALYRGTRLAREAVIVTDLMPKRPGAEIDSGDCAYFLPDAAKSEPVDSWWHLTPGLVVRMLGVLGFEDAEIRPFEQPHNGGVAPMYAVVAKRTSPIEDLADMEED